MQESILHLPPRAIKIVTYLLEAKALFLSIALHESHKSVPLKSTSHDISTFNPVWFAIDKLGLDINGCKFALVVYHKQSCDIA